MSLRAAAALLLAAGLGLAAGCGLLVPNEVSSVRCTQEGVIGPPACPAGSYCREGLCRDGPPRLGDPCEDDHLCAPGDLCVEPKRLGLDGDGICSRACCTSADCGVDSGLVCAVMGPGKLCVPADRLGRKQLGASFGGEPCAHDGDCRSGVCLVAGGFCIDACCTQLDCAVFDASCRIAGGGWTCRPAHSQERPYAESCDGDLDCASGLCAEWDDGAKRCAKPCCSSTECGALPDDGTLTNVLCVPRRRGVTVVYACAELARGAGDLGVGEPCEEGSQCRGGECAEMPPGPGEAASHKVCTDVCCTDASCGSPSLFACLPRPAADPPSPPADDNAGFGLQCRRR